AGAELARGVGTLDDARAEKDPNGAALAAWSLVHGFSLLWLNGNIPAIDGYFDDEADPMETVRRVAGMLFKSR
ncbi:MAG: TetR family transcriptional regulator, partial [Mycobacterium sp.]